jgi:hypothetical protein
MEGVVAGGVGLEGELDKRCPLRVDGNRADLVAVDALPDVEVAERGMGKSAAEHCLLSESLLDLGRQVARVEPNPWKWPRASMHLGT